MRAYFGNIVLTLASLVIGLFLAELSLRVLLPKEIKVSDDQVRSTDSLLGHKLIPSPDLFHDSNGFKNREVLEQADIVALGDSHTYGVYQQIEESWPAFLGSMTNKSVYNMGVGGYGPMQYYSLTDEALKLKPEYVVVGLLLGNDAFDAYNMAYNYSGYEKFRSSNFQNDKPTLTEFIKKVNPRLDGLRKFIRNHSVLYDFLAEKTLNFRENIGLAKPRTIGTNDWSNVDSEVSLKFNDDSRISTLFWVGSYKRGVDLEDKNIKEGLRITLNVLTEIKNKVDKAGTKLIVALIPTKETLYRDIVGDRANQNAPYIKMVEHEREILKTITAHCLSQSIECVDLKPTLKERLEKGERLFSNSWDGHPIAQGYKAYAEIISPYIK